MFRTYELFTIRGLPLKIHGTTALFFIFALISLNEHFPFSFALLYTVVGFAGGMLAITLHELGHILVGKRYGIETQDIILSPIGGMARMMGLPDNPHHEIRIALAGPLVSLVLAIIFSLVASLLFSAQLDLAGIVFLIFARINQMLFGFNLLPSFPMDGGRVLRAVLTQMKGFERATEIATQVGRYMAIAGGIYGLASGRTMLVVIAVFIYIAAGSELRMVRMQAMQRQMFGGQPEEVPEADFVVGPAPYAKTTASKTGPMGFVSDVFGTCTDLFQETVKFIRA